MTSPSAPDDQRLIEIPEDAVEALADGDYIVLAGDGWAVMLLAQSSPRAARDAQMAEAAGAPVLYLSDHNLVKLFRRRPVELRVGSGRYLIKVFGVDSDEWSDDGD
jgi:hypothetical protein